MTHNLYLIEELEYTKIDSYTRAYTYEEKLTEDDVSQVTDRYFSI